MKAKKKKDSRSKASSKYSLTLSWNAEDSIWVARFPELPGCSSHGTTVVEAVENADIALDLYLESLQSRGIEIPEPVAVAKASGKFLVRTKPVNHKRLLMLAAQKQKSMNSIMEEMIEEYVDCE